MIKILISSVGSLVGQNILDSLETRRDQVKVVGLNSVASNPRLFRCDIAYLVPPIAEAEGFLNRFLSILEMEKPDLILPGRDEDVVFLAHFKVDYPEFGGSIISGSAVLAEMMLDKFQSYLFAKKHNIPFAESFLYRSAEDHQGLVNFVKKVEYPIVVKPKKGFASEGIFYLTNSDQLEAWVEQKEEVLFQEFLGDLDQIEQHRHIVKFGVPHFFQIPEENHTVAQVVYSKKGKVLRAILTKHIMIGGRAESLEVFRDAKAEAFVLFCAEKYGSLGWRGLLNLQFKKDRQGMWKLFELNPRMVGASSARVLVGFDEIGMLVGEYLGGEIIEDMSSQNFKDIRVMKTLVDVPYKHDDYDGLKMRGLDYQ